MQGDPPQDWPLSEASFLSDVRPHIWHVQQMGEGPDILLLHGTGASTHSWRALLPNLAQTYRVTAIDLPGHGFTRLGVRQRSGLETMATDIAALCAELGIAPKVLVGHSAGTAISLRLADRLSTRPRIIGLNPALQPFHGLAGLMFPVAARVMAMTPGLVDVVARSLMQPERVRTLLAGTGSYIGSEGTALYARLFQDKDHVDGTLLMMAQWKLDGLHADLPRLRTECLFLTGSQDRMVPPIGAVNAASQMPFATVKSLDGFGHLVHEEAPDTIARIILDHITE